MKKKDNADVYFYLLVINMSSRISEFVLRLEDYYK